MNQKAIKKQSKIPQDIVGTIAILKFKKRVPWLIKKYRAYKFLKQHKNVLTVVEKTSAFSGKLRIPTTKYLAGEKTYKTTYKENNCIFKFNINNSYFSPRLSNERKIISEEVNKLTKKKNTDILIMFAGIGPYPITIAKTLLKQKKPFHIYANELNKLALQEMQQNIHLNKLSKHITILPGDANNIPTQQKFDIILMPRPNLKETFLKSALKLSKKDTTIFYHGFGTKDTVLKEIKKDTSNKTSNVKIRKAGDIAAYKFRWQAKFRVKN